jgi:hypothetical protein
LNIFTAVLFIRDREGGITPILSRNNKALKTTDYKGSIDFVDTGKTVIIRINSLYV